MPATYLWANLCILVLFLLVNDSISQINQSCFRFKPVSKCPTVDAGLHRDKLSSKIECAIVCSEMGCDRFCFDPVTGSCCLGDACSVLTQWADGDCESFQCSGLQSATAKTGIQDPLFGQLQMRLFCGFGSGGLLSGVSPGRFCLAASSVAVDSGGAHFGGSIDSCLGTETPGFERFLDCGGVFSFCLQVRHVMNPGDSRYHSFIGCAFPWSMGGLFGGSGSFLFSNAHWTKGGLTRVTSESPDFLSLSGRSVLLSLGCAYNGAAHMRFYSSFSRSLLTGIPNPVDYPGSADAENFRCLRLGFEPFAGQSCLNGTVYCCGVSAGMLGFDDCKLLDACCNDWNYFQLRYDVNYG